MSGPDHIEIHAVTRYEPVLRLVRELGGGRLLEVGGGHLGIWGYGLTEAEWEIVAVEYGEAELEAAQRLDGAPPCVFGDARDLPFEDRSFDVVVALDLLEHIAPSDRATVLRELGRVAGRRVIVGCPTGAAALAADRRLPALFERLSIELPAWLHEHYALGFPEPDDLRAPLEAVGSVRLLGNENVRAHERLMRFHLWFWWRWPVRPLVNALPAALRAGRPGAGRIGRAASALVSALLWVARGRDRPPTYRTIAVVEVGPAVGTAGASAAA